MCVCNMWEERGGQGRLHKEACVCPAVRRAGFGDRFGLHGEVEANTLVFTKFCGAGSGARGTASAFSAGAGSL